MDINEIRTRINNTEAEITRLEAELRDAAPADREFIQGRITNADTRLNALYDAILRQQTAQPLNQETLESLFVKAYPDFLAAQAAHWVVVLSSKYPQQMQLALTSQNLDIIREMFNKYTMLPCSTTIKRIETLGIYFGDQLMKDSILYTARKLGIPSIAKKLEDSAYGSYNLVNEYKDDLKANHLVPTELFESSSPQSSPSSKESMVQDVHDDNSSFSTPKKLDAGNPTQGRQIYRTPVSNIAVARENILAAERTIERNLVQSSSSTGLTRKWALMPHYPTVLDAFPRPLEKVIVSKLVKQLNLGLNFLHQKGLVHMDVKPSNIFIDQDGNYYLGDFGSVTKIDHAIRSTTTTFFPQNFQIGSVATIAHDFWMMAMTIHDVTSQGNVGTVGMGASDANAEQLLSSLTALCNADVDQLIGVLHGV